MPSSPSYPHIRPCTPYRHTYPTHAEGQTQTGPQPWKPSPLAGPQHVPLPGSGFLCSGGGAIARGRGLCCGQGTGGQGEERTLITAHLARPQRPQGSPALPGSQGWVGVREGL